MLVISRKKNEKIIIVNEKTGQKITVTLAHIFDRNSVRIGVDAPRDIPIFREELISENKKHQTPEKGGSTPGEEGKI